MIFNLFLIYSCLSFANSNCGNDWVCLYNEHFHISEERELKSQEELEKFRSLELDLQQAQLEEMRRQNDLLEMQDQKLDEILNREEQTKKPDEDMINDQSGSMDEDEKQDN